MTGDVRRIYGNRVSMFGLARPVAGAAPRPSAPVIDPRIYGGNR